MSEQQKALLLGVLGSRGKVILVFDNDEAGKDGAGQCVQKLVNQLFVTVVRLPDGIIQPDEISDDELLHALCG